MANRRGLLTDFIFILIFYGFDLGSDFAVLFEAQTSYNRYKAVLGKYHCEEDTRNKTFLHCSAGPWVEGDYTAVVESFGETLIAVKFFLALGCLLVSVFLITNVNMIYKSIKYSNRMVRERERNTVIYFVTGLACSLLQDIPMSCLAVDLYADRSGSEGLICWECSQDDFCNDRQILGNRFSNTMTVLVLSLTATVLLNLYKGVTTFYRWSKVDNVHCFEIRACVSVFVGGYYALVIMTPSLGLFKYKFFVLSSETVNPLNGITDSLFMLGMCGWGIFIVVALCCPLLHFFRD